MIFFQQRGLLAFVALAMALQLAYITGSDAATIPVSVRAEKGSYNSEQRNDAVAQATKQALSKRNYLSHPPQNMEKQQANILKLKQEKHESRSMHEGRDSIALPSQDMETRAEKDTYNSEQRNEAVLQATKQALSKRNYLAHPPQNMEKQQANLLKVKSQKKDKRSENDKRNYLSHPPQNMEKQRAAQLKVKSQNKGTSKRQYFEHPGREMDSNDGEQAASLAKNSSTVGSTYSNGTTIYNNGTMLFPNGTTEFNNGTMLYPNGTLLLTNGTKLFANDTMLFTNGTMISLNGTSTNVHRLVSSPSASQQSSGAVLEDCEDDHEQDECEGEDDDSASSLSTSNTATAVKAASARPSSTQKTSTKKPKTSTKKPKTSTKKQKTTSTVNRKSTAKSTPKMTSSIAKSTAKSSTSGHKTRYYTSYTPRPASATSSSKRTTSTSSRRRTSTSTRASYTPARSSSSSVRSSSTPARSSSSSVRSSSTSARPSSTSVRSTSTSTRTTSSSAARTTSTSARTTSSSAARTTSTSARTTSSSAARTTSTSAQRTSTSTSSKMPTTTVAIPTTVEGTTKKPTSTSIPTSSVKTSSFTSAPWTATTSLSITASTTATASTATGSLLAPTARPAVKFFTVKTGAGTNLTVQSNEASYGYNEVMADLKSIMSWAGDDGNLTADQMIELVAALMSSAARYWPEFPTQYAIRIMLGDIRTESDFRPGVVGAPRLDSGDSYGLFQLSPSAGSQEMPQFQQHATVNIHNFTYGINQATFGAGVGNVLVDWISGQPINQSALTNDDLYRPWINVHMAQWQQSNMARTASSDPWMWPGINDYSANLKSTGQTTLTSAQQAEYDNLLYGYGPAASRSFKTALGSWVAGPATNGNGSYLSDGDDISAQYFASIMKSVNFLYYGAGATTLTNTWLEQYAVLAGLVDFE